MKTKEKLFKTSLKILSLFSILALFFIISFILRESLVFFKNVQPLKFITRDNWNPLGDPKHLAIGPIIQATIYISLVALALALPIAIGTALGLSCYLDRPWSQILNRALDLLAGIPSVVYGFIGLLVLVKAFENLGMTSGESVLAGAILLAIMILPYIVSSCTDTMIQVYKAYQKESMALGVSKAYFIRNILLPQSRKGILAGTVLGLGRAMGETMAVMMVIGNAPIKPRLLGKCQTIPSLIALEMGMVEVGSLHYHALFSAGFVLMVMILIINIVFYLIKKNIKI